MNEELTEEWREYNGYQVSNYGKVINKNGKVLSTNVDSHGYVTTSITGLNRDRIKGMHRIVATVFLPNPNGLPEVNHLDGVKTNNRIDNLEWCTKKGNQDHEALVLQQRSGTNNYMNKLTDEKVIEIHNLCKEGNLLYKDIAKLYEISNTVVSSIARAIRWRHLGLEPIVIKQGSHYDMRKYTNM